MKARKLLAPLHENDTDETGATKNINFLLCCKFVEKLKVRPNFFTKFEKKNSLYIFCVFFGIFFCVVRTNSTNSKWF